MKTVKIKASQGKILTQTVKKKNKVVTLVYTEQPEYERKMNEPDSIFYSDNIAQTFVRYSLKKLASFGNPGAIRIINNYYRDEIVNDLRQEVKIGIWEVIGNIVSQWYFIDNGQLTIDGKSDVLSEIQLSDIKSFGFTFTDYEQIVADKKTEIDGSLIEYEKTYTQSKSKNHIMGKVSNYLYEIAKKYNENDVLFVELYNETVDQIELQSYANWQNIEKNFRSSSEKDFIESLNSLLTERQLTVLKYYHDDYNFTEISQILDCSVKNVSKIYHKAIEILRKHEKSVKKTFLNV